MVERVFITGCGVVSSLGLGREAFWSAAVAGRSGFSPVEGFDAAPLGRTVAAQVKGFNARDFLSARECTQAGRAASFAIAAARMAVDDAGLAARSLETPRASVIFGTTMGEADVIARLDHAWIDRGPEALSPRVLPKYAPHMAPMLVARHLKTRGRVLTLPAACAAGNYALGFGFDLLRSGAADVVIAGATEMLQDLQYAGFVRLGAVAPTRCQPFDRDRQGLIVGEGSAVFVLETERHALARGATRLAEIGGYGLACDGYHITRPHPEGSGNVHAMREAIRRSGVTPDEVDFINAHGTGTRANDEVEARVIETVFAGRKVPVTSVKSMIGHCMGASSALEALTCVETLQSELYPPTMHYENPDPLCPLDVVANTARRGPARIVLNNALAFGGYDAVLCLAQPDVLPPPSERGS